MSEQHFNRVEGRAPVKVNPWNAIWLHPRLTIRYLLDTNPTHCVLLLAMLGGISNTLDSATSAEFGDNTGFATILIGAVIGGIISGIVGLYIGGWLIRWTGSGIGGRASSQSVRTVLAWSNVPGVWILGLSVLLVVVFGKEIFASETPSLNASPALWGVLILVAVVQVVLGTWSIVILIAGIAEAQGFTALRAFSNLLLGLLIILVVVVIIGILVAILVAAAGGLAA